MSEKACCGGRVCAPGSSQAVMRVLDTTTLCSNGGLVERQGSASQAGMQNVLGRGLIPFTALSALATLTTVRSARWYVLSFTFAAFLHGHGTAVCILKQLLRA